MRLKIPSKRRAANSISNRRRPLKSVTARFVVAVVNLFAGPAIAAPATQPTTKPLLYAVSGRVEISLAMQKPDYSHAVVYFASDPTLDAAPLPCDHYTVAQKNKRFVPNFIAIPRNGAVEFPNWDPFAHNVFSRSAAAPAFDLDRYPCGCSKSRAFTKVGVVQVFCNIHPFMRAIIFVTPNPYSADVHPDGRFTIPNVPAGHYELVAWHDRCQEQRLAIEVGLDASATPTFHLSESRQVVLDNTPADRKPTYGVDRGLGVKREVLHLPVVTDVHPALDPPPAASH